MKDCKYRLPCSWCDKYDRLCEYVEFEITKKNWEKINEHECEHEWYQYIIDCDEKRKYMAHICSKCDKATIEKI